MLLKFKSSRNQQTTAISSARVCAAGIRNMKTRSARPTFFIVKKKNILGSKGYSPAFHIPRVQANLFNRGLMRFTPHLTIIKLPQIPKYFRSYIEATRKNGKNGARQQACQTPEKSARIPLLQGGMRAAIVLRFRRILQQETSALGADGLPSFCRSFAWFRSAVPAGSDQQFLQFFLSCPKDFWDAHNPAAHNYIFI
jgi:hypothetical protein